jgi:hypothetical protein
MTLWPTPGYWRAARAPAYSLSFAFPLLLVYEILALSLSHGEVVGVRNAADVLLKSLFVLVGGREGLVIFGALLVGGGAILAWRDYRRRGTIRPGYFAWMAAESTAYALTFGFVAGALTTMLLPGVRLVGSSLTLPAASETGSDFATQVMISLGAGIYEELLFRVLLVGGLAWLAGRAFRWSRLAASWFAVVVGALIFSSFHYVGPYGDSLELGSFAFRTVAGLLFSGMYLLRSFGITAWTHALYDIFLALGR